MTDPTPLHPEADALATEHLDLVGHVVHEVMGRVPSHVDRNDLTSAGMAALVRASRAYEPERGVPFVRYAATRIRGAVLDELRSVDWATRAVRRLGREVETTRARLAGTLGRSATSAEVAAALGIPVTEVEAYDEDVARAGVLSLQGGPDGALDDVLVSAEPSPEKAAEHRERLEYLAAAIAVLPPRLRTVVREYFLAERPMAEIATTLGVTQSRVSQIRAEALVLLRDALHHALDPELVVPHPRPDGCAARRRESYFEAVASAHAARLAPSAADRLDHSA